ncbi:GDP-mannose transporter into the lumen of the Golgi [Malassezia sp. CBS 17886]|nr:GDP-mannose transporter into the lumen of the Golgi [Malassezia sp. CBS 17886]
MAGPGGGRLAGCVSREGALGCIGAGYMDAATLEKEIGLARGILGAPGPNARLAIGINFLAWNLASRHGDAPLDAQQPTRTSAAAAAVDAALRSRPCAVWLAFGETDELGAWIEYVRGRDAALLPHLEPVTIIVTARDVGQARLAAEEWGADVIVVTGTEAGGHGYATSPPRDELLADVRDARVSWHVLNPHGPPALVSAGGITDGRQLAAQLALGADGAVVGTRFLLTPESLYTAEQKRRLCAASGRDTVRSMGFDDARGTLDWPHGVNGRGLRSETIDEFEAAQRAHPDAKSDRELPGAAERQARYREAIASEDAARLIIWSGSGIGRIHDVRPAADIVQEMAAEAVAAAAAGSAVDGYISGPGDDAAIELGPLRGHMEPGAESDSARSRLLSSDDGGAPSAAAPSPTGGLQSSMETSPYSHAAAPVLSYCMASILMTVVNKFTVSGAGFSMNLLVLLCQCAVGITMVCIAQRLGWIQLRGLNYRDCKSWFPISTMLVFVIWTGSKALQYLNIPIYTIFKNLTIILIAYGEVLWFDGRVTPMVFLSFVLMVLSSVVAAWPDMASVFAKPTAMRAARASDTNAVGVYVSMHPPTVPAPPTSGWMELGHSGYFWMLVNCLVSAAYVLVMRKRIKHMGFKDWDTMFYNNLLSIPVLAVMSLAVENWSASTLQRNFPEDRRMSLILAIIFSGSCAVFISYTTAWCIRTTSSTTYSMVGALNKLPLALSGMVFFGDKITPYNSLGIFIGFLAGIVYAVGKNRQAEAARLANTAATGVSSSRASAGGGHVSDPKGVIPMHTTLSERRERLD